MKLKVKKSIIASTVIFSMNISRANEYIYIVKKSDTLTSILYEKNLKPIYGKHGTLAETLKLNPKIKLSGGGNKIFPKMKIILANVEAFDKVMPTANSQRPTELSNHQPRDSLRRCPV